MADNELDRSDIIIEGETATWPINMEGDIQGTYTGTFRFRCFLTPVQKLTASREYRELLGSNPSLALENDVNLAFSLAQLKQRILSAPPFWTSSVQVSGHSGDIPDENVINAVLDAAVSAELKYRKQLKKRKEEAIQKAKKAAEKMLTQQEESDEGEDPKVND